MSQENFEWAVCGEKSLEMSAISGRSTVEEAEEADVGEDEGSKAEEIRLYG